TPLARETEAAYPGRRDDAKRGAMRTFAKIGVVVAVVAVALFASGALKVHVSWLDNDAYALDLFGKGDDAGEQASSSDEPFWQQGSGKPPVAPRGVPHTFAARA